MFKSSRCLFSGSKKTLHRALQLTFAILWIQNFYSVTRISKFAAFGTDEQNQLINVSDQDFSKYADEMKPIDMHAYTKLCEAWYKK